MSDSKYTYDYGPLYTVWKGMKQRCFNEKTPPYHRYGGRGITVCLEWMSFAGFKEWGESSGFTEGMSIDRIDNDGHYCPENCQWLTRSENTKKCVVDRKQRDDYTLTLEQASQIKRLALAGNSSDQSIADKFGVSRKSVANIARGKTWSEADPAGVCRKPLRRACRNVTKDEEFRIAILADLGDNQTEIAELFGITQTAVSKIRKRFHATEQLTTENAA